MSCPYFKMGWFDAVWLLGLVGIGTWEAFRGDWLAVGIDFGAALLLWPLIVAQKRTRDAEQATLRDWQGVMGTLADGGEVTLKKDPLKGGYEPVETPVEE